MQLQFVEIESAFDHFVATEDCTERQGKPVAYFSDKHAIFQANKPGAAVGTGMFQFGRALHHLNIDIACANTGQAKGCVERVSLTLQNLLVKEMRLAGIANSNIRADNYRLAHRQQPSIGLRHVRDRRTF